MVGPTAAFGCSRRTEPESWAPRSSVVCIIATASRCLREPHRRRKCGQREPRTEFLRPTAGAGHCLRWKSAPPVTLAFRPLRTLDLTVAVFGFSLSPACDGGPSPVVHPPCWWRDPPATFAARRGLVEPPSAREPLPVRP